HAKELLSRRIAVMDDPTHDNLRQSSSLQLVLATGAFALCFAVFGSVSAMMPVLRKQFRLAPEPIISSSVGGRLLPCQLLTYFKRCTPQRGRMKSSLCRYGDAGFVPRIKLEQDGNEIFAVGVEV